MGSESPGHSPTLYQKTIQGGAWVLAGRVFQQLLTAAKLIVLARLLSPRDFGILGIAMLVVKMLNVFTETGMKNALIQRKAEVHGYLNAVWTVNLVRGFVLFLLLYLAAPWVTLFFDSSVQFDPTQIRKPAELAQALRDPQIPIAGYVSERFSEEGQEALSALSESAEGLADASFRDTLSNELNRIIREQKLYTSELLESIEPSAYLSALVSEADPQTLSLRANRLVLEQVFPDSIRPAVLNRGQLTGVLRLIALTLLIQGAMNVRLLTLTRDLNFKKLFGLQILQQAFSTLTVIVLALFLRNVWALGLGTLIGSIGSVLLGYGAVPYRPALEWNRTKIRELWNYGKYVLGMNSMNYLVTWGDDLFVGRLLGPLALGYYRYAYQIACAPATEIGDLVGKVSFPAYSKIQDDLQKVRNGYEKATRFVALLCFPVTAVLFVLAEEITQVLFGPEWLPMVPAMRVVAFLGLLRCVQTGYVFLGLGRPDLPMKIGLIRLVIMFSILYPLTQAYGIQGTSLGVLLSALIVLPIPLYYVRKLIGHTFKEFVLAIRVPLAASVVMTVVLLASKRAFETATILSLAVQLAAAAVGYLLSLVLFGALTGQNLLKSFYSEFLQNIQVRNKNVRNNPNRENRTDPMLESSNE